METILWEIDLASEAAKASEVGSFLKDDAYAWYSSAGFPWRQVVTAPVIEPLVSNPNCPMQEAERAAASSLQQSTGWALMPTKLPRFLRDRRRDSRSCVAVV